MFVELNNINKGVINEESKEVELSRMNININDHTNEDNFECLTDRTDNDRKESISESKYMDESNSRKESVSESMTDHELEFEEIRNDLQTQFGDLFNVIYKTMDEMIPENAITFDKKNISVALIKKLTNLKSDRLFINKTIEKVAEFFSLILKERETKFNNK